MEERAACPFCGYPDRELLTPAHMPRLRRVEMGNWILLKSCPECGQLWCEVPHGPWASYSLAAAWPCGRGEFRRLNDVENARILHEWHMAVVRRRAGSLPPSERTGVEQWLRRLGDGHGVVDNGPWRLAPEYVREPSDLELYIRGGSDTTDWKA
jgi:hypothetical protein